VFAFVVVDVAVEVTAQRRLGPNEVLGMDEAPPGLDRGRQQLVEAMADKVRPALVHPYRGGRDIPFPGTCARAPDDVVEARAFALELGQRLRQRREGFTVALVAERKGLPGLLEGQLFRPQADIDPPQREREPGDGNDARATEQDRRAVARPHVCQAEGGGEVV
ncbi:hypothetical protein RZS08_17385, partial [Arthrospira platensis SPKY1]|nr:hypothetical protein [Arthrospira platensis SPKY1]